jgi:hypothetical protein
MSLSSAIQRLLAANREMWTNIFRWLFILVAGKAAKGQPGETSNAKIQTSKKIQISRIKPEWREERFGDAHWSEYPDVVGEGGQVGVYELDDPTTADSPDRHLAVANHGRFALHRQTTAGVPQTSQSAVSRVSQPADRPLTGRARLLNGLPIGKSAIPQVGKPAVRTSKMPNKVQTLPPPWALAGKTGAPVDRAFSPDGNGGRGFPGRCPGLV